ncbi:MAG: hypothetical protein M1819_006881 [Sarea resinae]|nr:MAG: hypothetical protein M1819_006881 [Sarea resinae]
MATSIKASERKAKVVFNLDSPYSVGWPIITDEDQGVILELLCRLLAPIGQHRANFISPSKGKRSKKRKRREAKIVSEGSEKAASSTTLASPQTPPAPELRSYLTIGFNDTTRHLEAMARRAIPCNLPPDSKQQDPSSPESKEISLPDHESTGPISVIFLSRSSQPSVLYSHLPLLTAVASSQSPDGSVVRLVSLPKGAEVRLATALGLPRVGQVGLLEGAPHAGSLLDYVRQHVPVVEAPWLKDIATKEYLPVKINALQTTSPAVNKVNTKANSTNVTRPVK